jgi:hypothetical protein
MFRLAGTLLALVVLAGAVSAQDAKSKPDVTKESKDLIAWLVKVDPDKKVLTVMKQDGKQMELSIDEQTKVTSPQGAASADGVKDRRLTPGTHVKLFIRDGMVVKEVHVLIGGRRAVSVPPPTPRNAPAKDKTSDPKIKGDKRESSTK